MDHIVYISLGSNISDRVGNLVAAVDDISKLGKILSRSSLYETEPVGFPDQPWFLNCTLALDTCLAAEELLDALLTIEKEMGRIRGVPNGPRIIDLDILLFGNHILDTRELTLPHPRMHTRRFVLEPMNEIAPEVHHPVLRKTVRELHTSLPNDYQVRDFTDPRWQDSADIK